tara:strand:- start:729 stop:1604 length:876 start_codon:yes stop_codon:yes gene_type:complete
VNKYLIFRTDRIGDFLVSAILIKSIKFNDPKSHISIIASKKNYEYIKNFPYVDNVIKLENNFLNKLNLLFKLHKIKFKAIVVHDNKNRSKILTFFLKSTKKIFIEQQKTHIEIIKKVLEKLDFTFNENSLNLFSHKKEKDTSYDDFVQLHLDEKWIFEEYIKKFVKIEPNKSQLINFIDNIISHTKKNLVITTGQKTPKILLEILPDLKDRKVRLLENLNFLELEEITLTTSLLISCHGAISHVASANKVKQIDIIDTSYDYFKWTKHFRNYDYLIRDKFENLSIKILKKL